MKSNDPLDGKTLEFIVTYLVEYYGWEQLGTHIRINCFTKDPSLQSSLKFLRKTPWARKKVENLYISISNEQDFHLTEVLQKQHRQSLYR